MSSPNTLTEAERLVHLLHKDYKEPEKVETIGKILRSIADSDEEQMVEFLKNEDAITIFIGLLFDISALHPGHAYLFWHVLNQQYKVCQKRFDNGCMQVLQCAAKTNRMMEALPVYEGAFKRNDLRLLKILTMLRDTVGKDAMWRLHYDDESEYAQLEFGKVKLFVKYICKCRLTKDMFFYSLNDLMTTMMGQDALKYCFCKQRGISRFGKLLGKWNSHNHNGKNDDYIILCLRILDSVILIVPKHQRFAEGEDIKNMCRTVLEVLTSRKNDLPIVQAGISLVVKVIKLSTSFSMQVLELGYKELVRELQGTHAGQAEISKLCAMFLSMTSTC